MLHKLFYGPPNWIVQKFSAEDRRAFFFWVIVLVIVGTFFFGNVVLWVSWISVLGMVPSFTGETPVEHESKD